MPNQKISAMTAAGALTGAEIFPLLQGSANKQDTLNNIAAFIASTNIRTQVLTARFNGGGAIIPTGLQADFYVPYECDIIAATLLADQATNFVVDLLVSTYAGYPPVASICGGNLPTITSPALTSQDNTLTGWTGKHVLAGSVFRPNITVCSAALGCTLALTVVKRV